MRKINWKYQWINEELCFDEIPYYFIYESAKKVMNRVNAQSVHIVRDEINYEAYIRDGNQELISYNKIMTITKEQLRTETSGLILEQLKKDLKESVIEILSTKEEMMKIEKEKKEQEERLKQEAADMAAETKRRQEVVELAERIFFSDRGNMYTFKECVEIAENSVNIRNQYLKDGMLL